jgi:hypothetical protein
VAETLTVLVARRERRPAIEFGRLVLDGSGPSWCNSWTRISQPLASIPSIVFSVITQGALMQKGRMWLDTWKSDVMLKVDASVR